jgi:formylmethanofuran dehydrogenase subunit E
MSNPMEKLFEELGAKVLEQTMCDNCLGEFPDEEMRYDPNVRDGAPVCQECYELLTN